VDKRFVQELIDAGMLTPEQAQAFMAQLEADAPHISEMSTLGAIPDEQGLLQNQIGQGMQQQNTPLAQGQNAGRAYVASSPLEHLAVALQRGMGGMKQREAEGQYRDTLSQQTKGREASASRANALERILLMMQRGQQPATPGLGLDLRDPVATPGLGLDLREKPLGLDLRTLLAGG